MKIPTTTAGAPRPNGIDVVLYCTYPVPESDVLPVLELLCSWGFHCDMFVDSDLAQQAAPPGTQLPHFSVVPPEWMGPPMSTLQELQDWLDRIGATLQPGSI